MSRKNHRFSVLVAWGASLVILLSQCAGSHLNSNHSADQSHLLPQSLKDQFEVRDVAPPGPLLGPSPSPLPVAEQSVDSEKLSKKELKRRNKKSISAEAASFIGPMPFVNPIRRPAKDPIWVGEKLTYEVTYLGIRAGFLEIEALPYKMVENRKVYYIKATATSSAVFSLVYRLEDTVETFIDFDGFYSHRFHLHQDESKQIRDSLELYDSEKRQSYWANTWDRKEKGYSENKDYYPMVPFPQDSLSSIYYLRSVSMEIGKVIEFPVMSEGKPLDAYVTVVKRENMDTPMGSVPALKLKPEAATHGVLERKGDSFIWLTDDDRRFLIRVEAKVKIGSVIAQLKKVELGTPP